MNSIKSKFSIKDLENLSGIKAHTIRIWEKRYEVLKPMRTGTNIRCYDMLSLQKLLNITLLHNHGYKISKIATYPDERIPVMVKEIISRKSVKNHAINAFKVAMMNFDQKLFFSTYNKLLSEKTFREIFYEVIIPMMNEIGLLWQVNTITPAHEHFISHLLKQKLLYTIENIHTADPVRHEKVFVLFLPQHEVHELGLLYINYEIVLNGYKAIYLGSNVPMESLVDLKRFFDNIVFVTYLTVEPSQSVVCEYVEKMAASILDDDSELWLLGQNTAPLHEKPMPENIKLFTSIDGVVSHL